MESTAVQKIAKVLNILVLITFICNLIALFLVPGVVFASPQARTHQLFHVSPRYFLLAWTGVWGDAYLAVLTLFLLFSGVCTAVILRQARRVLNTILRGEPFSMENALSLNRAAACAFLIAAAALARVVFSVCWYRSAAPLATYNALFVPLFAMFGLLCLVMSALFRQAAELKAENDLTI
ncbi:DUF2975 domain-containing protein [uncultured Dysosmobacter sp.]|uniref:DUF2975 domain-containing protein n=1 Tax=uncultured Dysosmobacter sp. TaxID=2591384 RepID=UPI00261D450E|nr:DUF2975 domain-containing protein [uncultured Dysosmobacter sp.]